MMRLAMLSLSGLPIAAAPVLMRGVWSRHLVQERFLTDGAIVQSGCTIGRMAEAVVPDKGGAFTARRYFGSPASMVVLTAAALLDRMAVYGGRVQGRLLLLSITVADKPEPLFRLQRGKTLRPEMCSCCGVESRHADSFVTRYPPCPARS
jgi:hypothetical protein